MASKKIENLFVSMRFVLPEQRAAILELKEEQKLIPQPVLEEDELASFQYQIMDAARNDYAITVTWWKQTKGNLGTTCSFWGVVKWIDLQGRRMKLVNDEDVQWIDMDSIVSIKFH